MITVLFEVGHLYHRAALDPLCHVFRQDKDYEVAFACSYDARRRLGLFDRSLKQELEARFRAEGLVVADDPRGFDVVIVGDPVRNPGRFGSTLLCFVNHGTGIKKLRPWYLRALTETRYQVFVEGEYRLEVLRQEGFQGVSTVHKVGLPKLDPLFWPGYPSREAILGRLGLDHGRPTVLFAPTYKPTCIDLVGEQILQQTQDYNLIIKLHQYSWRGKYAPHWHHRLYERAVQRYQHAVLLPDDDYNVLPYLHAADTLISEASSTMFDFLGLDKTGIVFVLPEARLRRSTREPMLLEHPQHFLEGAFVHIRHPSEIREAIELALRDDPERRQIAQRYRDYLFFGVDGKASLRVKATIERLLAEGGHTNCPRRRRRVRGARWI
jgi:hypothetical protein